MTASGAPRPPASGAERVRRHVAQRWLCGAAQDSRVAYEQPYVRHIGVPRIDLVDRPGLFWLVPPDRAEYRHVDAEHLCEVLRERRTVRVSGKAQGGVR